MAKKKQIWKPDCKLILPGQSLSDMDTPVTHTWDKIKGATKRFIEQFGQAQCCCPDCDCYCTVCKDNCAPCCFLVTIDGTTYVLSAPYVLGTSCVWRDTVNGVQMRFMGTTLSITKGNGTWQTVIVEGTDCTKFSSLSIPKLGEGNPVSLTSAGKSCIDCPCICTECADTDTGRNAPCCLRVRIGSKDYYLSRVVGGEGCSWSSTSCRCGPEGENGTISLTVLNKVVTLDICGDIHTVEYAVKPNCCDGFTVDGYTLHAASELSCLLRQYECIQVTISGVTNNCGCSACYQINGTFSLGWTGASYEGTICTGGSPYSKCGYSNLTVLIDNDGENIGEFIVYLSGGVWQGTAVFKGMAAAGDDYVATYFSGGDLGDCNLSEATITITMGPECAPCGAYVSCLDPINLCNRCKDDVYPSYYEVTIPAGFIGGWGWTGAPRTYLIPALCEGGYLETGNHECLGDPRDITVNLEIPDIKVRWGSHGYEGTTDCLLLQQIPNWNPTDYCPGDNWGSFDCYLYGQTLSFQHQRVLRVGSCCWNPSWDLTKVITIRAIP